MAILFHENLVLCLPQNIVSYSLLTKRICSLPNDHEVWTRYRLIPQAFDDSSSCWHGNLSTGMTCCADSKCIEVKISPNSQILEGYFPCIDLPLSHNKLQPTAIVILFCRKIQAVCGCTFTLKEELTG